jgi:radical SAM superfamily enzyme YgiQ (UPF0313 family)
MKILLIHPPYERVPKEIPLGLAYIASFLQHNGHKVDVLDIDGYGYGKKKVEEIISGSDCDCFGIGGLSSTYRYVKWLASIIKFHHPHKVIIAGNMVATAHPETLLKNSNVDIAVIGEGEVTCKELLDTLGAAGGLDNVKGLAYKKDGKIIFTPPRERIQDLNKLPFPAWENFPVETYLRNPIYREHGLRSLNISTIRGCPFDCIFCSRVFGRTVTKRSIDNIISEIRELIKRYRVQYIAIIDDLFISDQKHVYEFCDKLIAENLNIRWGAAGRVNLINEPLLKKMKAAGCDLLSFGFESGSQKILDIMKKHVRVEQAEKAIKLTRQAGIRVIGSFMLGMIGETRETVEETINFIKRTDLPNCRFFFATPYPGTVLYDMANKMGRIKQDEDGFLESLGEMADTLAVNLTDFSDQELVDIKRKAEERLKSEARLAVKWRRSLDVWQSRLGKIKMGLYYDGLLHTIKGAH